MKKKQYKTTEAMRVAENYLNTLQEQLPKILSQSFWQKKVSIEDKIKFFQELSRARMVLWEMVYKKYPETKGKNLEFNQDFIREI